MDHQRSERCADEGEHDGEHSVRDSSIWSALRAAIAEVFVARLPDYLTVAEFTAISGIERERLPGLVEDGLLAIVDIEGPLLVDVRASAEGIRRAVARRARPPVTARAPSSGRRTTETAPRFDSGIRRLGDGSRASSGDTVRASSEGGTP